MIELFERQWRVAVRRLITVISMLLGFCAITSSVAADELSLFTKSFRVATPRKVPLGAWNYNPIYFVTNRYVDEAAANNFGKILTGTLDLYVTSDGSSQISLGEACVAYPSNRLTAEQDYPAEGEPENPAKHFTTKELNFADNTAEF